MAERLVFSDEVGWEIVTKYPDGKYYSSAFFYDLEEAEKKYEEIVLAGEVYMVSLVEITKKSKVIKTKIKE